MAAVMAIATVALRVSVFAGMGARVGHKPALREIRMERLPAPILSLDVAPGSDLTVTALSDGRVRAWHLDNGETVHEFRFTEPETDQRQKDEGEVEPIRVHFAPDGKTLGVSYLSRVHLYDVSAWSELKTVGVEGEDVMRPISLPQLTSRPAVEKEADDINTGTKKWDQRKTRGDGRTRITDFAFTADGEGMVVSYCRGSCYDRPSAFALRFTGGHDPVRLWEFKAGRMLWEHYSEQNQITERVVLSTDSKLLVEVVAQPGHWLLQLRELASGRESRSITLTPLPHEPPDIAFTSDSQRFVTLWSEPRKMWQMALFDTASGQVVAHFTDHAGAQRVALSDNGLWLAITTWRGVEFKVWNLEMREPVLTMTPKLVDVHVRSLHSIRFASDSRKIVVSDQSNGLVFIYELTDVPSKSTAPATTCGLGRCAVERD